jgi:hypothetical protein
LSYTRRLESAKPVRTLNIINKIKTNKKVHGPLNPLPILPSQKFTHCKYRNHYKNQDVPLIFCTDNACGTHKITLVGDLLPTPIKP